MALRKGLSLGISYPGPQALAAFPGKGGAGRGEPAHCKASVCRQRCPLPPLALPGSLSLLQPGTKRSLLEPSISDVSMQDSDTKVWAEVGRGDWKLRRVGSRGGQGLVGWTLETEQKGYFKGTGLGTGAGVGLRPQVSPGPLVMLTWLFQGVRCGLGQNLLGERISGLKKERKKKQRSTPFFSFSQPQSKSTLSAIETSHLRNGTLSDSICQDFW